MTTAKSSKTKKPAPPEDVLGLVGKTVKQKGYNGRPGKIGKVVATWMSTNGYQIYEVKFPHYNCGIAYQVNEARWLIVLSEAEEMEHEEEAFLLRRRSERSERSEKVAP